MTIEQADYAKIRAFIDEDFAVQITSISVRTASGNIPVHLLNEGLAGFTDGSQDVAIAIGYVIPASGFEFNFHNACGERGYHTIQVSVAGTAGIFKGKFSDNDIGQSMDQATAGTVNFMGGFSKLE